MLKTIYILEITTHNGNETKTTIAGWRSSDITIETYIQKKWKGSVKNSFGVWVLGKEFRHQPMRTAIIRPVDPLVR